MRLLPLLLLLVSPTLALADDAAEPEPRLAVATDPIGLFADYYTLSGTYVTSRHAGVRADVSITGNDHAPTAERWRASLNVPLYLDRPMRGPFVEPGLAVVERGTAYGLGGLMEGAPPPVVTYTEQSVEPQIFVGWQFLYRSRMSIAGAISVARHDNGYGHVAIPMSYLRVGLAL